MFYQDFKDTFVCNTQLVMKEVQQIEGCFIRISKILLYAIHNEQYRYSPHKQVVLSGFQRYFCMQYTTIWLMSYHLLVLFYQDFKDTFVCNTQRRSVDIPLGQSCFIRISKILLYAIHNWNCCWCKYY